MSDKATAFLEALGWDDFFAAQLIDISPQECVPGRVLSSFPHAYSLLGADGEQFAALSGHLKHRLQAKGDLPVVGDWVLFRPAAAAGVGRIEALLARRTLISRKAAGQQLEEQAIAANVDVLFQVSGLDGDFNLRRIERYLALAGACGTEAVVLLNKADICPEAEACREQTMAVAEGVPVHLVSALQGVGLDVVTRALGKGRTGCLLGSSGVGKSTIINYLMGQERQRVQEVRAYDDRGRHTTTRRELIRLPDGSLLIDNPGMRELSLWTGNGSGDGGTLQGFADIEALATGCRFRNCTHRHEPGCAVVAALEQGTLEDARYRNYIKLREEAGAFSGRPPDRIRHARRGGSHRKDSR